MPSSEFKNLQAFIISNFPTEAINLAFELRKLGISTDFDLANRKFNKQFEKASKLEAQYAVILGEDEIKSEEITLKELKTGIQSKLTRKDAAQKILGS